MIFLILVSLHKNILFAISPCIFSLLIELFWKELILGFTLFHNVIYT